jgi:hypothetical protein
MTKDRIEAIPPCDGAGSYIELESRRLARTYAGLGWYITPLKGKAPYLKGWPDKAINCESTIARWIAEPRNIGLVTGSKSRVVVIDVDPRNGGEDSLAELARQCGSLPDTLICNTGGGGQHFYFRYFDGAKSGKPLAGIDFQCDGRCVVLPPSVHPDTGALYVWEGLPDGEGIAELPDAWRQALGSSGASTESQSKQEQGPILEGSRNDTLFNLAVDLAKGGASESRILRELAEENATRCIPPLELEEIDTIVRGSLRYRQSNQSVLTRFQQAVGYADMPMPRKAALWALSLDANQHGRSCYPTQERIADRSGMTRETVGKHLAIAEAEGWISRITHSRAIGPGFNYSYHLKVPDPALLKDES